MTAQPTNGIRCQFGPSDDRRIAERREHVARTGLEHHEGEAGESLFEHVPLSDIFGSQYVH